MWASLFIYLVLIFGEIKGSRIHHPPGLIKASDSEVLNRSQHNITSHKCLDRELLDKLLIARSVKDESQAKVDIANAQLATLQTQLREEVIRFASAPASVQIVIPKSCMRSCWDMCRGEVLGGLEGSLKDELHMLAKLLAREPEALQLQRLQDKHAADLAEHHTRLNRYLTCSLLCY